MPLYTTHLLALRPSSLDPFLTTLSTSNLTPLVLSHVIRWIILPTHLSTAPLLAQNTAWSLLLILPSDQPLPTSLSPFIAHHWHITAGVPSRLTTNFYERNKVLLNQGKGDGNAEGEGEGRVPRLEKWNGWQELGGERKDSAQALELSGELRGWFEHWESEREKEDGERNAGRNGGGPVSMFNLLAFKDGMKDSYLEYGKAFAREVGSKFGGVAKVVGSVVDAQTERGDGKAGEDGSKDGWSEIALAQYPSVRHFASMLADGKYQEVNKRHRVPALRDTAILMTREVHVGEVMGGRGMAKL